MYTCENVLFSILFRDDNAPFHTWNIVQAEKHDLDFESLPHLPYSPDLAHIDYYLLPNLNRWLWRRRFESNEELEWETEWYFGQFDKSYYLEDIGTLKDRWTRCIELKGEYIKEYNQFLPKNKFLLIFLRQYWTPL